MPFVFRSTGLLKQAALLSMALILLAACASETQRREGLDLVIEGHYEEGLAKLEQAQKTDPDNATARRDYLRQREQILNRLLVAAGSELAQEHYDAAEAQLRRVLAIDPANDAATNGLAAVDSARRHDKWLAEAQALAKSGDIDGAKASLDLILMEAPDNNKANQLRLTLAEQTLKENIAGPTLNIQDRKPVTLQFRDANLKMVLEAIARITSLNILLDKDVRSDAKVTIFVKDTPVEETLDLILLQNQLEKRVLGENTVLIYPFNPSKSKDYQELKVRRFSLTNAEPKQVQTMLKTILKTKDIFVDEKTNAVIIRDTPEAIRLAEKMVASMDQPEAEVMIELELLDMDRNRSLDLGVNWPTSVSWMLPDSMTLQEFRHRSASDVTLSVKPFGATVKALETDGDTRVLANPRIRARNKEKAKIMIGSRTPVISSAAVPNTTGQASVYNTNIQYIDTGIKLEVEPTIYLDGDVAIKLNMEVSDLGDKFENVQTGTLAYATTTNNASTILRLKDGETQILAGLVRAFTSNGASQKVPGLGDIPLLGRLFGIDSDKWQNREIVLAITPHIIRNNQIAEADLLEFWSGTEANIKFGESKLMAAGTAGLISQGQTGGSTAAQPIRGTSFRNLMAKPASPIPAPAAAPAATPVPAPAANAAASPLMATLSGPGQAKMGDKFTVSVNAQGMAAINGITLELQYDAELLKAVAVTEGDLMRHAGVKSTFDGNIDESGGKVTAALSAESGTASDAGGIASIEFEVISDKGNATVVVSSITATGDNGSVVAVSTPRPLTISIVPQQ
ncbi:MAG: cohesin domain-containing protein [Georgfuchsia sp.]